MFIWNNRQFGCLVTRNTSDFCLQWVRIYLKDVLNSINFYKRILLHIIPLHFIVLWLNANIFQYKVDNFISPNSTWYTFPEGQRFISKFASSILKLDLTLLIISNIKKLFNPILKAFLKEGGRLIGKCHKRETWHSCSTL